MLLYVRRRFLFVHIAKTGGTSVRAALQRGRWADPWYWPMFLCSRFSHLSGHRIATKLPRHAKVVAAKELKHQAPAGYRHGRRVTGVPTVPYCRRHPEQTALYQVVQQHLEHPEDGRLAAAHTLIP